MDIRFHRLQAAHFALLLKWLEAPHVKAWWDPEICWTSELIEQKYTDYTQGIKKAVCAGGKLEKPLHAYIIEIDRHAIGYIQYYNAYNFPREGYALDGLPHSLAAMDIFIGEQEWVGRGIGPLIIDSFLKKYIEPCFNATFVDPDLANKAAIRTYEKAGFKIVKVTKGNNAVVWMVREKNL